jgi:hypothetical protein
VGLNWEVVQGRQLQLLEVHWVDSWSLQETHRKNDTVKKHTETPAYIPEELEEVAMLSVSMQDPSLTGGNNFPGCGLFYTANQRTKK